MTKTQVALDSVEAALAVIENEITAHGQGVSAHAQQLKTFRSILEILRDQLVSGTVPPRDQRLSGMSQTITDSWPFDSKLGLFLLIAEHLYLDL